MISTYESSRICQRVWKGEKEKGCYASSVVTCPQPVFAHVLGTSDAIISDEFMSLFMPPLPNR